MIDYISAKNYKVVSVGELMQYEIYLKQKIKDYQNILIYVRRAIKKRIGGAEC